MGLSSQEGFEVCEDLEGGQRKICWGSPTEVPELFPRGMARGPTDVVVNLADKIDKL